MGLGAVVGGLYVAGWGRTGMPALVVASGLFGLAMLGTAAAPNLPLALVGMALVGASSVAFLSTGNSTLQLALRPPDARPGDGALGGGVPRVDADRRADRGRWSSSGSAAGRGSCWAGWRASSRPWPGRWWCD